MAIESATNLLSLLTTKLTISSVFDVGCREAAWLSVWRSLEVENVFRD